MQAQEPSINGLTLLLVLAPAISKFMSVEVLKFRLAKQTSLKSIKLEAYFGAHFYDFKIS